MYRRKLKRRISYYHFSYLLITTFYHSLQPLSAFYLSWFLVRYGIYCEPHLFKREEKESKKWSVDCARILCRLRVPLIGAAFKYARRLAASNMAELHSVLHFLAMCKFVLKIGIFKDQLVVTVSSGRRVMEILFFPCRRSIKASDFFPNYFYD